MATIEATMPATLQAQLDRLQTAGARLAPEVLEFGKAHRRFKQAVMAWEQSVPDLVRTCSSSPTKRAGTGAWSSW